jgi:hypothetical protein
MATKKRPPKGGQSNTPSPAEKAARDNRSRQLDSQNDAYWKSRGRARPKDS